MDYTYILQYLHRINFFILCRVFLQIYKTGHNFYNSQISNTSTLWPDLGKLVLCTRIEIHINVIAILMHCTYVHCDRTDIDGHVCFSGWLFLILSSTKKPVTLFRGVFNQVVWVCKCSQMSMITTRFLLLLVVCFGEHVATSLVLNQIHCV